jgi:hypothetical protein
MVGGVVSYRTLKFALQARNVAVQMLDLPCRRIGFGSLMLLKKDSATALSQQLPRRLMLGSRW